MQVYVSNTLHSVLMKITKREYTPDNIWSGWQWRSINDLYMNGAFFVESGTQFPVSRKDMLKGKPGSFVPSLTRDAGFLVCRVGKPC